MDNHFKAPWDTTLKIISSAMIILFIILGVLNPTIYPILVLLAIGIGLSIFIIKGYSITDSELIIQRLLVNKVYDLRKLNKIEINESAINNAWRLFGIGGAFSYSGLFWNKKLGKYYAYTTDRKKSVVLYFEDKTIVVTPDLPEKFSERIKAILSAKS